ncbi:MAG: hypothetical protein PVH87_28265 [Desulfobacteraceae bacterium]
MIDREPKFSIDSGSYLRPDALLNRQNFALNTAIQGQECDRQVFDQHGFEHTRLWTATALGFPIKIVQPGRNDWYVLIQNIRQAPIAETRFRIPVDFSLKTSEELIQIVEADPETAVRKEAYKKIRPRKSELQAFLSGEETWNSASTLRARPWLN